MESYSARLFSRMWPPCEGTPDTSAAIRRRIRLETWPCYATPATGTKAEESFEWICRLCRCCCCCCLNHCSVNIAGVTGPSTWLQAQHEQHQYEHRRAADVSAVGSVAAARFGHACEAILLGVHLLSAVPQIRLFARLGISSFACVSRKRRSNRMSVGFHLRWYLVLGDPDGVCTIERRTELSIVWHSTSRVTTNQAMIPRRSVSYIMSGGSCPRPASRRAILAESIRRLLKYHIPRWSQDTTVPFREFGTSSMTRSTCSASLSGFSLNLNSQICRLDPNIECGTRESGRRRTVKAADER